MAEHSSDLPTGGLSLDGRRPHRHAEPSFRTQADGMAISEVADQLGTTVRALRYYEDQGLLSPARNHGGVRRYTLADRKEAERVVTLRMLGLSLKDIRMLQSKATDEDRLSAMTHTLRRRRACLVRTLAHIDMLLQGSPDSDGLAMS